MRFSSVFLLNCGFSNCASDRLRQLGEQMAEAVGEEMVELPKLETEKDEEDEQELANDVSPDSLGTLWDDEDTKAFYENLPGKYCLLIGQLILI